MINLYVYIKSKQVLRDKNLKYLSFAYLKFCYVSIFGSNFFE